MQGTEEGTATRPPSPAPYNLPGARAVAIFYWFIASSYSSAGAREKQGQKFILNHNYTWG